MVAIVLDRQSLKISAPTQSAQFVHHLSLLNSHSDSQCRESLAYLTNAVAGTSSAPLPWAVILPKLFPLMTRASPSLRAQLLKFFRVVPAQEVRDHIQPFTMYVRTAMTHLSREIRIDGVEILRWILDAAGPDLVASGDGWTKMLKCFVAVFGWDNGFSDNKESCNNSHVHGNIIKPVNGDKAMVRALSVFGQFLQHGIGLRSLDSTTDSGCVHPFWHVDQHLLPRRSDGFAYLNLFGSAWHSEHLNCADRGDRQKMFQGYHLLFAEGLEIACQQGGEMGRTAATVIKIIKNNVL